MALCDMEATEIVCTVPYRHGWTNRAQGLPIESSQYENNPGQQALFKAGWCDADIEKVKLIER